MTPAARVVALDRLVSLPAWLVAAADPAQVGAALAARVPELAGAPPVECKVERLRLRPDGWAVRYRLTVDGADGHRRALRLAGTLRPPLPDVDQGRSGEHPADPARRIVVPELGLDLHTETEDPGLPALATLTDPELARPYLEGQLRQGSTRLSGLRLRACRPEVLRYKPGNRCTIRYELGYGPDDATPDRPEVVVVKTYAKEAGASTWAGMRAMWASPLGRGDPVRIAEPLAYDPGRRVLVQGMVPGERTLKQLVRSALRDGSPAAEEELGAALDRTAAGLAALHGSGVRHGEAVSWDDELAKLRAALPGLALAGPEVAGAAAALIGTLVTAAAAHPPDPPGPAHRAFRPAQVLLDGVPGADGFRLGFIDFDGFCQAEPAMDVGVFLAALTNIGMYTPLGERQADLPARLGQVRAAGARFLDGYRSLAPVSAGRVAVWEALELATYVLNGWIKVQPSRLANLLVALGARLEGLDGPGTR
ncbi:MAG TPA: phosphotransferase [Actinomycetes bacterium]|nr:phosphotransferase [Actinomycetes bacterium]